MCNILAMLGSTVSFRTTRSGIAAEVAGALLVPLALVSAIDAPEHSEGKGPVRIPPSDVEPLPAGQHCPSEQRRPDGRRWKHCAGAQHRRHTRSSPT
jgi:hypothetical protein